MTELTISTIGNLKADISLKLETRPSAALFRGRSEVRDKNNKITTPRIVGVSSALRILTQINFLSARNDPYADKWLLDIESWIDEAQKKLAQLARPVNNQFTETNKLISITEAYSIKPGLINLHINTPIGYQLIYLLKEIDLAIKKILLAKHIGLISKVSANIKIYKTQSLMRSITTRISTYIVSGVTRNEFSDDGIPVTDMGKAAIQLHGHLPIEIITGKHRSQYAPDILDWSKII